MVVFSGVDKSRAGNTVPLLPAPDATPPAAPRSVALDVLTRGAGAETNGRPWTRGRSLVAGDPCTAGAAAAMSTCAPRQGSSAPATVRYDVSIPDPASGYLEVTATFPTAGKATIDLAMPRWTPGSYLIRDYAKNVDDDVAAVGDDGAPRPIAKAGIDTWQVTTQGAAEISVRYRVFGRDELAVSSNWVDPSLVLMNGAATFMTTAGEVSDHRCDVTVHAPTFVQSPVSGLSAPEDGKATFTAPSYDILVDTPIVLGAEDRREFVVDGVTYVLATQGGGAIFDAARAVSDLQRLVAEAHAVFGKPPFTRYVFHNILSGRRGGLEHLNSTVLMESPWSTRSHEKYLSWLGVATHEFVHAWNVKRMRPQELGPFDYSKEAVTPSLWVAEGITAYYEQLLVRRAGLMSSSEFLAAVSRVLAAVEGDSGHSVQTLADSSRDSWIKFYQRNANTANVTVSYYAKGGLVGMMLDCEIRKRTNGARSLDDVMRLGYARFSGEHGYSPEQWEATASEIAGADLKSWFDRTVREAVDLPVDAFLANAGLRLHESPAGEPASSLGADTKIDNGLLLVTRVVPGTAAADAGVIAGDEIIGFGGYRIPPSELEGRLALYKPGESGALIVARRGKLETLPLTLGARSAKSWSLEIDPNADAAAVAVRRGWLGA